MKTMAIGVLIWSVSTTVFSQKQETVPYSLPLNSTKHLEFINAEGRVVEHNELTGLEVIATEKKGEGNQETLVLIPGVDFMDGVIDIEVAGSPVPHSSPQARGFIGIAFRVSNDDHHRYECVYLRPANGRADLQVQRNHSVQYTSHPDHPWHRLRKEFPGKYETYVDLVPGEWTKMRVEVLGTTMRLFVHGAEQPTLIVNDLKHGVSGGGLALWLHESTLARFRNLVITPTSK